MANSAWNTAKLREAKKDLKKMKKKLRFHTNTYGREFSLDIKQKLEDYNYNQGSDVVDTKPDQVDLADSWEHYRFLYSGSSKMHRIYSTAPHAKVIDQGTEGGWSIPKTKAELGEDESLEDFGTAGVSWEYRPGVGNADQYVTELVESSGRFFYPSVTAGSYGGKFYVQSSLRTVRSSNKDLNDVTREAIIESGFKPGR